jgi:copper chaperone CopZ
MAARSETLQVTGIRCERCVQRLAGALSGHDGLEFANANLMGEVLLSWDEERTDLDALLAAMAKAGFRAISPDAVESTSTSPARP